MKKIIHIFSIYLLFCGIICHAQDSTPKANYNIIPHPRSIQVYSHPPFVLTENTIVSYDRKDKELARNVQFLTEYIKELTELQLKTRIGKMKPGEIHLSISKTPTESPEAYNIHITPQNIQITGTTEAGIFYGIQTLRKSIPIGSTHKNQILFPTVQITDAPRFKYRGMMLDVSRHFFTPDEVKRYIDILALHNINHLHWHLTDDQGWRIEIKKYPRLIEIGSKRQQTVIGHNSGHYDGKPYGGYYTQEQIKDIINYAAQRYVTIIPEIDLPGHQQAALAAYPEFGCTGGPYTVGMQWGISDEVICAGNEKALSFLEDVLDEVIKLFPSPYIHIGGDECPKTRWKKCPKCQERIKEEGIKSDNLHSAEEYLQSYVISRMEKFVESKGKHIIGWDEILEGGLAPNATVMSWRGVGGGIEAAKQHHDVIMTPNSHLYFDYYQTTDTKHEPIAIGGYIPVERVYSLEPTDGIPEREKSFVLGVQANLWTEYIPSFRQVEYMVLPRMAALSEVQWTLPESKDYNKFLQRIPHMFDLYEVLGYNYAKHLLNVEASFIPDTANNCLKVRLNTLGQGKIFYTIDGTDPSTSSTEFRQENPIKINHDAVIKAFAVHPAGYTSRLFTEKVTFSKSSMKPITLKYPPSPGYKYKGAMVLTDGIYGTENYKTGRWLGFQGNDVDAIIDLQTPTEIHSLKFNTNVIKGDWIMRPTAITIRISDDNKNYREILTQDIPELTSNDKDGIYPFSFSLPTIKTRYVEIILKNEDLPKWHSGAGYPAFIFIDEFAIL